MAFPYKKSSASVEGSPAEERIDQREAKSSMAASNAHVGKGVSMAPKSSGKMMGSGHVNLGTFHGKHQVSHPVKRG